MARDIENVSYFKIEMPQTAAKLRDLIAQGGDSQLSERALRHQIGSAIDIVVQISRYADGSRRRHNNRWLKKIFSNLYRLKYFFIKSFGHRK